ncbi:MAG: Riboflavin biosynthesis protein RibA [Parcubacteria group bacterium Gr01-1014_38]|nr:MAG: Riboflavin biosynthesis protein RibA [Parcubacteria group bacterium Gr01-1014_38]
MASPVPPVDLNQIAARNNMAVEEVERFVAAIRQTMEPFTKRVLVRENGVDRWYAVERRGIGSLNTKSGKFWQFDFVIDDYWEKYSVIVRAQLNAEFMPVFQNKDQLVLRTDSGCETGQVFGDLSCECYEQLHLALKKLNEVGEGMIVHVPRQDGRGMGLPFKLATMWLQDELKLDTVEAASVLAPGGVIDVRTYAGAVCVLKFFDIPTTCKVSLATNNPKKAEVFTENGYTASDFEPMVVAPTADTLRHLLAKQQHLGHIKLVPEQPEQKEAKEGEQPHE